MGRQLLHFSLGPVQTFISHSRRTRDLWAGSFLLSWLSAVAMHEVWKVRKPGGVYPTDVFAFPRVEQDRLFRAVAGIEYEKEQYDDTEYLPSLPNSFKARVPPEFEPDTLRQAVEAAWQALARHVWYRIVAPAVSRIGGDQVDATWKIWSRQIGGHDEPSPLWEYRWVMGPEPGDASDLEWLDRRKFMRSPATLPEEAGDLCTMMPGWQELSGHTRYGRKQEQQDFWGALRKQAAFLRYRRNDSANSLDLGEQDRLCAPALVKRLFPLLPTEDLKAVFGWVPKRWREVRERAGGEERVRDVRYWPSTSYMAAVRWIERAKDRAPAALERYAGAVRDVERCPYMLAEAEKQTKIAALDDNPLAPLDGSFFFESAMHRKEFLDHLDDREAKAQKVLQAYRRLIRAKNDAGQAVDTPAPYYALLAADGDRMGQILRRHMHTVPQALAAFAKAADCELKRNHAAVPIYIGADDLLAFVPIEDAIPAALAMREVFKIAFRESGIAEGVDLSAAVLFCHMRTPLRWALEHVKADLLEGRAKRDNGRASLAVGLRNQSGTPLTWVSAWEAKGGPPLSPPQAFQALTEYASDPASNFGTNRFCYHLLERMPWAFADFDAPTKTLELGDSQGCAAYAEAILNERPEFRVDRGKLEELLQLCHQYQSMSTSQGLLRPEPILLLRFLKNHWCKRTADDEILGAAA